MKNPLSRREFVKTGAASAMVASAPEVLVPKATRPVVIASANGNKYKNGGPRTAVEEAFGAS